MTEARIGLLFKTASAICKSQDSTSNLILKSYYLMRCKDFTLGNQLPDKHFSVKVRCPKCCIEWTKDTETKVRSIKLSKRQKHRLKSTKITGNNKEYVPSRKNWHYSNELEQICRFCRKSTITPVLKPQKLVLETSIKSHKVEHLDITKPTHQNKQTKHSTSANLYANSLATCTEEVPMPIKNDKKKKDNFNKQAVLESDKLKQNNPPIQELFPVKTKNKNSNQTNNHFKNGINVYANSVDVFSLHNKSNNLTAKENPKPIKNNKKKKDKFAGLCQKAVTASAKLKEKKNTQSPLNLFLKPSSS